MKLEIESVTIRQPYNSKGPMLGEIRIKGIYGMMELKIEPEMIKPIIDVVASAIADAGRQVAENLVRIAEEHMNPVIEHTPDAAPQLEAKKG